MMTLNLRNLIKGVKSNMITAIVKAIGDAMTGFVSPVTKSLVDAFTGLFWTPGTGDTAGSLTTLAEGLLAIVGISLVIGCIVKVYHIFSGRVRRTM